MSVGGALALRCWLAAHEALAAAVCQRNGRRGVWRASIAERLHSGLACVWCTGCVLFIATRRAAAARRYNARQENGGQRVATVLMYLATPEEGGETVFPYAEKKVHHSHTQALPGLLSHRTEPATVLQREVRPEGCALSLPSTSSTTLPPPPPGARLQVEGEGWSECARRGLAVKAVKGNALLFYSLKPNGVEDNASTHGSCPTLAGEKWSATR